MAINMRTMRKAKLPFKQSEYDKLVTRKAKASLLLKRAKQELTDYEKTHTSGIGRLAKGDRWV